MKIGLIDSGIGAIAVAKEFAVDNYIILMDKAFFPYGKKSKFFLLARSLYLCEYLFHYCDEIVLACNTLSIIVLPFLKLRYKDKIRGILDCLLPYSKENTVFLGSTNTIKYLNMQYYRFPCLACDDLIAKIEKEEDVSLELARVERVIPKDSTVLLGCTHFIYIKDKFTHSIILPNNPIKKS